MGWSKYLLEEMGFTRIPKDQSIEAQFKSINVYQVKGLGLDESSSEWPELLKRKSKNFMFSFGKCVNKICLCLLDDNYVDDVDKLIKETNSQPPYLIVVTWLENSYNCNEGWWKDEGESIRTYNCFPDARAELRKKEEGLIRPLISSLMVSLSSQTHEVTIAPIHRTVYADTNKNKQLYDFSSNVTAELSISYSIHKEEFGKKIDESLKKLDSRHPKIGVFYYLASLEKDRLKKFIYYFLVLEVLTHQTFKTLKYADKIDELNNIPARIKGEFHQFMENQQKEAKNLSQRFIWCSLLAWHELKDSDIAQFKRIKKFRDSIYHGEDIEEKLLPVEDAKNLSIKLLSY